MRGGRKMKKELICIGCPVGCSILAAGENENIKISGNGCKKGEEYAKNEIISPKRVVTSTVRLKNGKILPVKTDREIPKDKIFECMKIINSLNPDLPIKTGDVILKNVFGCNIVSTGEMDL